jgi:hypothetical protein
VSKSTAPQSSLKWLSSRRITSNHPYAESGACDAEYRLRGQTRSHRPLGQLEPQPKLVAEIRTAHRGGSSQESGDESLTDRRRHCARAATRSRRRASPGCALNGGLHQVSLRRRQREAPTVEHVARQERTAAEAQRGAEKDYCREAASAARDQRQLLLPHCLRREAESLRDVLRFEVRIERDDLVDRRAICNQFDDYRYRNAQSADARRTAQLLWTDRDARKRHSNRLALRTYQEHSWVSDAAAILARFPLHDYNNIWRTPMTAPLKLVMKRVLLGKRAPFPASASRQPSVHREGT